VIWEPRIFAVKPHRLLLAVKEKLDDAVAVAGVVQGEVDSHGPVVGVSRFDGAVGGGAGLYSLEEADEVDVEALVGFNLARHR